MKCYLDRQALVQSIQKGWKVANLLIFMVNYCTSINTSPNGLIDKNPCKETEISLLTNPCYFLEDDLLVSRLVKCCFGGCIIASYDNCFLGSPCLCCHPRQVGMSSINIYK